MIADIQRKDHCLLPFAFFETKSHPQTFGKHIFESTSNIKSNDVLCQKRGEFYWIRLLKTSSKLTYGLL